MKTLLIRSIARSGIGVEAEELLFQEGVNVIVGRPNTGKTKWLQMLDFAFGRDKAPLDIFDDLSVKFDSIVVKIEIDGQPALIERHWKEVKRRTKVLFDGIPYDAPAFCAQLMNRLEIPIVHYPQGNPLGTRTWPELSMRGLLRHIYRQQKSWGDFISNQPTSEQHACILQFVGIAERLFSQEFGELASRQKRILELQAQKDQFLNMLHEVSRELLDEDDRGLALTEEAINKAIARHRDDLMAVQTASAEALKMLASGVAATPDAGVAKPGLFEEASERLAKLRAKLDSVLVAKGAIRSRIAETEEYQANINQELSRLQRALIAGETFANLKVTHCPACDKPIEVPKIASTECYVCGRETSGSFDEGSRRIAFELQHLEAESQEVTELIGTLRADLKSYDALEASVARDLNKVESQLRPVQQAAAAILPPEFTLLAVKRGQIEEKIAQLERVAGAFALRTRLTEQILEIETEVETLEKKVEALTADISFDEAANLLAEGMNEFCVALNSFRPQAWPVGNVTWKVGERRFDIRVGGGRWQGKLGNTLSLYFFIAYHYSLLRLSGRGGYHFPGFLILDLPAVLEDGESVHDKENFILEPFVELSKDGSFDRIQVIAAGSAFENLVGAHRIELKQVWTEGGQMEVQESQDDAHEENGPEDQFTLESL